MAAMNFQWSHTQAAQAAAPAHIRWAGPSMQHPQEQYHTHSFDIELEHGARADAYMLFNDMQQDAPGENYLRRRSASWDASEATVAVQQWGQQFVAGRRPSLTSQLPHYPAATSAAANPRGRASIDIAALALRAQKTMDDATVAAEALSAAVCGRQSLDPAAATAAATAAARSRLAARARYSSDIPVPIPPVPAAAPAAAHNTNWANSALFAQAAVPVSHAGSSSSSRTTAAPVLQSASICPRTAAAPVHTGAISLDVGMGYGPRQSVVQAPVQAVTDPYYGSSSGGGSSRNWGTLPSGRRSLHIQLDQEYERRLWQQQQQQPRTIRRHSVDLPRMSPDQYTAAKVGWQQQQQDLQRHAAARSGSSSSRAGRQSLDIPVPPVCHFAGPMKHQDLRQKSDVMQSMLYTRSGSSNSSCSTSSTTAQPQHRYEQQQQQQVLHQGSFTFHKRSPHAAAATHLQQQQQDQAATAAALAAIRAEIQQLQVLGDQLAASRAAAAAGSAAAAACEVAAAKHEAALNQALTAMAALEAAAAAGSSAHGSQDLTEYSSIAEDDEQIYNNCGAAAAACANRCSAVAATAAAACNGSFSAAAAAACAGSCNAAAAAAACAGGSGAYRAADHHAAAAAAGDYDRYCDSMQRWEEPSFYDSYDNPNLAAAAAVVPPQHNSLNRALFHHQQQQGILDDYTAAPLQAVPVNGIHDSYSCHKNNCYNVAPEPSGSSDRDRDRNHHHQSKVPQLRTLQQMQADLELMHQELAMLQRMPTLAPEKQ